MKLCGLWRPEGQLGRPFWAKPALGKFPGAELGPSEEKFCIWFLAGASGVNIGCCLNPVEDSFYSFHFVWWLDCLLLKEGASAFCSVRWLLEVVLAVAEFVGFREGGRLPFEWLYWILYCPLFFVFLSVLFVFVFLVFVFCLARWQLNGLRIDPFQFSFVSPCHYDQCCYCINSVNLHNAIVFPAW